MQEKKTPYVIAIAAVSGGGKTTITTNLNEALQNCKCLYFDEYDFDGPDDIIDWVDSGPNYDEWNLSPLIKDLQSLITESLDYVVIDYPFAYRQTSIKDFIDLAVFIDTPLDVAMARRIVRDYKDSTVEDIIMDMTNYVHRGKRGYLEMLHSIKPNSDIVVDGNLTVDEILNIIIEKVSASKKLN